MMKGNEVSVGLAPLSVSTGGILLCDFPCAVTDT